MSAQEWMLREEIGDPIRALRERRGLTLRELAELAEGQLSPQGISRIELGERCPSARTLACLAAALSTATSQVEFSIGGAGVEVRDRTLR
jgi:transcriptional regulator with XRE-family HTH domain